MGLNTAGFSTDPTELIHVLADGVWLQSSLEPVFWPTTGSSRDSNQTISPGAGIRAPRVVVGSGNTVMMTA
jgi:hypothetical protein